MIAIRGSDVAGQKRAAVISLGAHWIGIGRGDWGDWVCYPWVLRGALRMNDRPSTDTISPGMRVRVTKQVARQGEPITTEVVGVVLCHEQQKTGSWFAHSKHDKLWLDTLEIEKDDGERYICNIDAHTRIDIIATDDNAGADGDA